MKAKPKEKNIGVKVEQPAESCKDKHCPFHGGLKVRGRYFEGTVRKADTHGTIDVEWPRLFYLSKFERYEKRRSRLKAHKPGCMSVNIGDKVKIVECRPISKTKHFVVVEKLI